MNEFIFFIHKSEVEQRLRLKEDMVTVDEFAKYRLGTSAVRVVLAINEYVLYSDVPSLLKGLYRYCNGGDIPPHISDDEDFASLWDLTNVNICK